MGKRTTAMNQAEKILQKTRGEKWLLFGRWKEPVILENCNCEGITNKNTPFLMPLHPQEYIIVEHRQFVSQKQFENQVFEAKKTLEQNPSKLVKEIKKYVYEGIEKTNKIRTDDFNVTTARPYFNSIKRHGRQWYEITLLDSALQELYPASLPHTFTIRGIQYTPEKLLAETALPKKIAPMIQERLEILEIAQLNQQGQNPSQELQEHTEKYSWMNSLCWWDKPFDYQHYLREATNLAKKNPGDELSKLKTKRGEQHQKALELLDHVKKEYPEAFEYIDAIRELTYLKEENWDAVSKAGTRMRPSIEKRAGELQLDYYSLIQMSISEFLEALESNKAADKSELQERMKGAIVYASADETIVQNSRGLPKLLDEMQGSVHSTKTLSGTVVWPGNITGKARVMNSVDDVSTMQEGEILICPMTDPDYFPAIHKAAAIVTDQGGLLCHAAIVARELQKPCIVGTQHATILIKTGELVRVETDKATVTRQAIKHPNKA